MSIKKTFTVAGPIRTSLNLAIVALLAGGAAFDPTDVAARDKGQYTNDGKGDRGWDKGDQGWGKGDQGWTCAKTTQVAYKACGYDVQDNYLIAQAKCLNVTDATDKATCFADAKSARQDDTTYCGDVRDARSEVCGALTMGGGPYDPPIAAMVENSEFFPADQIDGNDYYPLKPGTVWVYKNTDDETITVTVTDQTAEIEGVPVRVVTDVVVDSDGKITENTQDWYGEDVYGNVWYMGENTLATNSENMLVSNEGAWETAVDGAKPGIVVPAVFTDGDVYRQEWLLGDAEDIAENLTDKATESAPKAGVSCDQTCRKTHEYSPLEPDKSESKFYAQGVGVIVTLDDNDPAYREELVTFTPGS
jgi:hypothetical protein